MFEITNHTKWETYIPLLRKQEIAEHIAAGALVRYRSAVDYGGEELFHDAVTAEDVPTRWRYMMGVLLKYYLHIDFEPVEGEDYLMAADDYDRAASTHILNVLERMKSDAAARDKVFDLLRDYKDLERMVSAELNAQLAARNDILPRILQVLTQTATPAALANLQEMEGKLGDEAKRLAERVKNLPIGVIQDK